MTCNCPSIDGYRLRRKDCPHHATTQPSVVPEVVVPTDFEAIDVACAWSDYRSDYGASGAKEHKAFKAGWLAAREGDQSGVLR